VTTASPGRAPARTPAVPRTADVVVIGAGPAGCAAAMTLARGGRDVVVIDRARFPRDKCCGDGLTTAALRTLEELGLDPADVPSWRPVAHVTLHSPRRRAVRYPLPRTGGTFAAVARRVDLDAALVALARDAGAMVIEGAALTGAELCEDRAVLTVGTGAARHIEARYAIGADGAWSPLRKLLGVAVPGYRGEWHAFRQYVTGLGTDARDDLHVMFEPDILPGYFWSFPVGDGDANIGFGIRRTGGPSVRAMKDRWPDLLRRPHIRALLGPDARPEGPHRAWPIPARAGRMPLATDRALFVGDAAAVTDPLTGEGIGQALATGRWAADAVLAAGPFRPAVAREYYAARVQRELMGDHRLADGLSGVLGGAAAAETVLALAGATPWTRRNFARWLFEDYPRAIVATPTRWRRHLLQGPGAYCP
jgi:menaquinone-9 beta-reductase